MIRNGIITKPIDLGEVAETVGTIKYVGNACRAASINKWAKYKPVHYPAFTMSDAQRNQPISYGGGTLSNGMLVPSYASVAQFKAAIDSGDGEHYYTYIGPQGGTASPYRLNDFVCHDNADLGYDPNARPPIAGARGTVNQEFYTVSFDTNVQTNNHVKLVDLVAFGDMTRNLEDYYLGALLVNPQGVIMSTHINSTRFGSLSTIRIPRSLFVAGTAYKVYPFLSSTNSLAAGIRLVPIEGVGTLDARIGADYDLAADAIWLDLDGGVTRARLEFTITANVDNYNHRMMVRLVDLVTGNQVGNSREYDLMLNTGQSLSDTRTYTNNTGHNCKFEITVNGEPHDVAIRRPIV